MSCPANLITGQHWCVHCDDHVDDGLQGPGVEPPPVFLASGNPKRVLTDCRRAAIKAGWLLETWDEFAATARACLSADATLEEHAKFLVVVEERFAVTRGPKFDPDPSSWAGAEREVST